jgi:hypothetical protein
MDISSQVAVATASAVGCTLLVAGLAKLRDPAGVAPLLRALGVGARTSRVARVVVPVLELCVGVVLLSARFPRAAAAAAALLSASFSGVLALARLRGVVQPCRCFGALDRAGSPVVAQARALLLLGAALAAVAASWRAAPLNVAADAGQFWPAWLLGALLALCALLSLALVAELAAFRAAVRGMRAAQALQESSTEKAR